MSRIASDHSRFTRMRGSTIAEQGATRPGYPHVRIDSAGRAKWVLLGLPRIRGSTDEDEDEDSAEPFAITDRPDDLSIAQIHTWFTPHARGSTPS